jgi:hypothetical protein
VRHQARGRFADRRWLDEEAGQEADGDDQQETRDDPLECALAAPVLDHQQEQRHDAGDHAAGQQVQVEEEVQRDGTAHHLGEIGGHRHQLGL